MLIVSLAQVMNRLDEKSSGLCLASTATQKGDLSALASLTDTSRTHDKRPALTQHAESETERSTENVLPHRGFPMGTLAVQLEKNAEANCLSSLAGSA
jgi:hypothetical protein